MTGFPSCFSLLRLPQPFTRIELTSYTHTKRCEVAGGKNRPSSDIDTNIFTTFSCNCIYRGKAAVTRCRDLRPRRRPKRKGKRRRKRPSTTPKSSSPPTIRRRGRLWEASESKSTPAIIITIIIIMNNNISSRGMLTKSRKRVWLSGDRITNINNNSSITLITKRSENTL